MYGKPTSHIYRIKLGIYFTAEKDFQQDPAYRRIIKKFQTIFAVLFFLNVLSRGSVVYLHRISLKKISTETPAAIAPKIPYQMPRGLTTFTLRINITAVSA